MPKPVKPKSKALGSAKFLAKGWKNVHSSVTSVVFTSLMPARIKNDMIEASKEKKILSSGSVFPGFAPQQNERPPVPEKPVSSPARGQPR